MVIFITKGGLDWVRPNVVRELQHVEYGILGTFLRLLTAYFLIVKHFRTQFLSYELLGVSHTCKD